ncbi:MAG: hypothetical protein IJP03_03085 [Christensenellaceae bacterium]|nr:hypothetical protein [Christensenellaceae bacterium]
MNKKAFFRTVAFLLVLIPIFVVLCELFEVDESHQDARYAKFREMEDGTIDAIYLGPSSVDRSWIAAQAYEDYGMSVYPLSSNHQPGWASEHIIDYAMRYQSDIKLVIIDVRNFTATLEADSSPVYYMMTQMEFFAPERWAIAAEASELYHAVDPENNERINLSYFLSFIRFHQKWSEDGFTFAEIKTEPSEYLGFVSKQLVQRLTKEERKKMPTTMSEIQTREPLDPYYEQELYELLDYLDTKDVEVLFVQSPRWMSADRAGRMNTIEDILAERGYDIINYNEPQLDAALDLDFKTDYADMVHLNYYGAVKYTTHFSKYLHDNYDLPDHRGEKEFESWEGVTDKIEYLVGQKEEEKKK